MPPSLTFLQQFVNILLIFTFDANGKQPLWKEKNEACFDRAAKNAEDFSFPGECQPSTSMVRVTRISTHRSGGKRKMPVEIIEIDKKEVQYRLQVRPKPSTSNA